MGEKGKLLKISFFSTLFSSIIALFFYLIAVNISALDPFEKAFQDFSFTDIYYSKKFYKPEFTSNIIIVNIEHHDRAMIALGIEKISAHNPAVIGVDIVFREQREPETDLILKKALFNPSVVSAYYVEDGKIIGHHTYFDNSSSISGFINLDGDEQEGVIRDFLGVQGNNYAFPVQVAIKAGAISAEVVDEKLSENLPIRYTGNAENFLTFNLDEILASDSIPALSNSIVLMGYLGQNKFDIEDKHFTPLNSKYVGKSIPDMHGVVIHANIIRMLTQDKLLMKIPKSLSYIAAFLNCWFLTFLTMQLYKKTPFLSDVMVKVFQLLIVIITVYFALIMLNWNAFLWITPILVLTILGLELIPFYYYLTEFLSKKFPWKS